jgi:hypothetical protein
LSLVWDVVEEDGVILLQREKKYNTIDDFLNNLPDISKVALYNYDLKTDFILEDYEPNELSSKSSELSSIVNYALRGPFQFYTYIKDEDLDFVFEFQDLNENKDSDEIDLHLYYNDQLIDSRHMDDPSVSSGRVIERGEIKLELANLPEGVYKIELRVNNDIVTKKIITKQKKLSFINKIWITQDNKNNFSLYSDSRIINAQTLNPGHLQTIRVGENDLKITETYKQFSIKTNGGINEIKLAKDDIILSGNGVFSFSKESLVNPEFKRVDANLDINSEGINYVLAKYNIPTEDKGWNIAKAVFDLTRSYREHYPRQLGGAGKYSFLISIPGLRADDEIDDFVEISEIRVDLEGTSLWEKIKKYLSSWR